MSHNTKTNGIVFLNQTEAFLDSCETMGEYQGQLNSIWGGKIGQSAARINAIKEAKKMEQHTF